MKYNKKIINKKIKKHWVNKKSQMERCAVNDLNIENFDGVWKILEDKDFGEKDLILLKLLLITNINSSNNANMASKYSKKELYKSKYCYFDDNHWKFKNCNAF